VEHGPQTAKYRPAPPDLRAAVVNLVALNVWLYPLNGLRVDLTSQREYSLSPARRKTCWPGCRSR
jgi:ABC-2 type transport system permease protein